MTTQHVRFSRDFVWDVGLRDQNNKMAPYVQDEVDVFTVPHSRMKELVNCYSKKLQTTNFKDDKGMQTLLSTLLDTFFEFKTHEQIENRLIMKKLKGKLKKLAIQNNAVCNCHNDNRLMELMYLIKDGYSKKTEQDRINFGLQLRAELEQFREKFLPHMKEEEEVFQPLLEKYFSVKELKALREKVIKQHLERLACRQVEVTEEWLRAQETKDSSSSSSCESDDECLSPRQLRARRLAREEARPSKAIHDLPQELLLQIFSFLEPKDLCRVARVNTRWRDLSLDPSLWREIYPVKWAQGEWGYTPSSSQEEQDPCEDDGSCDCEEEGEKYQTFDEDADIDESAEESVSDACRQLVRESQILNGLVKHVLPSAGHGVKTLVVAHSKALTSGKLQKILELCPNLEHLDVSYTKASDVSFKKICKGGGLTRLRTLNCAGCQNITDDTLVYMATASRNGEPALCGLGYRCCLYWGKSKLRDNAGSRGEPVLRRADVQKDCCDNGVTVGDVCHATCDCDTGNPVRHTEQNIEDCACHKQRNSAIWTKEKNEIPTVAVQKARNGGSAGPVLNNSCAECDRQTSSGPPGGSADTVTSGRRCTNKAEEADSDRDFEESEESFSDSLEFLSLSGCCYVSDVGLRALVSLGPYQRLTHLDLSGCYGLTGPALAALVQQCPALQPEDLFYCDNIVDGPYAESSSGCQNLECDKRVCCRKGF